MLIQTKNEFKGYDNLLLVCSCLSLEHQVNFWYDKDDDVLYINPHLSSGSFWQRLVIGIKYIFGYTSRYGDWDEMVLEKGEREKLLSFLKKNIDGKEGQLLHD